MLSNEQRAALQKRLADPPSLRPAEPVLWPPLVPVWSSWPLFGPTCTIAGGGMTAPYVVDNRAALYGARVRWLDEHAVAERDLYHRLWSVLDTEESTIIHEMLEAARG